MYRVKPAPDAIQVRGYRPRRIAGVQDIHFAGSRDFIGSLPPRPLTEFKERFQFAVKPGKDASAASFLFRGFLFIGTSWKEGEQSEYQSRLLDGLVERSGNRPASAVEAVENVQFIPD